MKQCLTPADMDFFLRAIDAPIVWAEGVFCYSGIAA